MGKKFLIGISVLLNLITFGALVAIAISIALQPDMVPLLPQSLSENAQQQICIQLEDNWRQRYEIRDDRILVPLKDHRELLDKLDFTGLLDEPDTYTLTVYKSGDTIYNFSRTTTGQFGESNNMNSEGNKLSLPKIHIRNQQGSYDQVFSMRYG